jgi:hypothetical protein
MGAMVGSQASLFKRTHERRTAACSVAGYTGEGGAPAVQGSHSRRIVTGFRQCREASLDVQTDGRCRGNLCDNGVSKGRIMHTGQREEEYASRCTEVLVRGLLLGRRLPLTHPVGVCEQDGCFQEGRRENHSVWQWRWRWRWHRCIEFWTSKGGRYRRR